MKNNNWNKDRESEFKDIIKKFFDDKLKDALKGTKNPLQVGNNLSNILKNSDKDVVKIITPRAVRKWASAKTFSKWEKILKDPQMVVELREIGKSIANTMRPLAGNNFALWVATILNEYFKQQDIYLRALTSGKIKNALGKEFINKVGKRGVRDYKPDIDIVLVRTDLDNKPVAIISVKTTLAERVMQTIAWSRYLKIPIMLVTAWETFESGTNRERVQELDGVYACNTQVKEYGKIKRFSRIGEDLKEFTR
ncbi:MAG: BsaWI family type II restriction enzyme [Candidatus Jorgensenbacteria bacterium]